MAAVDPSPLEPALAPPDQRLIRETLKTKLPFRGELAQLIPLAGDASNRRYFRLELAGKSPRSLVLMQLADPEPFKQSEEAVSRSDLTIAELPFINIHRHLAKADVAVPALYHYDQSAGLLYLEDFGDLSMTQACQNGEVGYVRSLYRQAIDGLVHIQVNSTRPADPSCLAFHRCFDVPLLMWEFDHFLEYGVVARTGKPMCAEDFEVVRAEFLKIAELLAAQPVVFTHRDYHSRNLMVHETPRQAPRLGVLDFQDALMGPPTYDLASLLRDSYRELGEPLVNEMLTYYLEQMAERGTDVPDRVAFRRLFDFTSLQRNLKAAGRFVYIERVKHNSKFLADIPRTLGYVRANLDKYPELAKLKKFLTPYVPELNS